MQPGSLTGYWHSKKTPPRSRYLSGWPLPAPMSSPEKWPARHPLGWVPWQHSPPSAATANSQQTEEQFLCHLSQGRASPGWRGAWISRIPKLRALIAHCRLKEPHCAQLEVEGAGRGGETYWIVIRLFHLLQEHTWRNLPSPTGSHLGPKLHGAC